MKTSLPRIWLLFVTSLTQALAAADAGRDWSPPAEERQLPRKMRSAMPEPARITVGQTNADILGADHRALQAAVDYVAGLGGGIVEIGPGEYLNQALQVVEWQWPVMPPVPARAALR